MRMPTRVRDGTRTYPDEFDRMTQALPEDDKPFKRLVRLGPSALTSAELLELILGTDTQPLLALRLLSTYGSLIEVANACPRDVLRVPGMTHLRAAKIQAAFEIGKRAVSFAHPERVIVRQPKDVADLVSPEMSGLAQEQLRVVMLNRKNRVIGMTTLYQGSVHTMCLRPAEIFREAVRYNSPAIVIAHNHPSGEPMPSPEDIEATRSLVSAGKALDIELMDHLVIGSTERWVSLKERGLGFG